MGLITDTILGFQLGLLVVICVPIFVAPSLDPEQRQRIAGIYWHMAMFSFRRSLLARQNTLLSLIGTSYNGKRNGEEFELGGETKHVEDVGRFMRTLKNRPFGLISAGRNAIVDPMIAEIAEFRKKQKQKNDHVIEDGRLATKTNPHGRAYTPFCPLPRQQRVVDPKLAEDRMHGSAEPSDANTVYVWGIKSQELFNRYDTVERAMIVVTAFVAGYGVTWFGLDDGGGAADTVTDTTPLGQITTPLPDTAGVQLAGLAGDLLTLGVIA